MPASNEKWYDTPGFIDVADDIQLAQLLADIMNEINDIRRRVEELERE